ncbi:MAG TPA: haloacid dehalogenase-like hydrolase [Nocardioides sp.]|nr:haloacid dehalogenase-like hydrolase [Nocardioides sp.]
MPHQPLVVGFDLDLTLIDSRPGIAATLRALLGEHPVGAGVELDVDALCERLGPPLDHMLAPYYAADLLPDLVDRFRVLYPDHAVAASPALAGAHEALAAVRRHGGRTVVVTGKFTPNAARHVARLGLEIDHLAGEVWGVGKAAVLREQGASVYVGDHVHDVAGALAADALSVSVLTGGCTAEELLEAGTHAVLRDLGEFPAWLDEHVARAAGETPV